MTGNFKRASYTTMLKRILTLLGACPTIALLAFCSVPAFAEDPTPIHAIQGSGDQSPLAGKTVTIEGVVTGDFQTGLEGFFVQEEEEDADEDSTTSEGIFVFDKGESEVSLGQLVRVRGKVVEYKGLTELTEVESVEIVGQAPPVEPLPIDLPVKAITDWEAYEGMLVTIPETMTVSGNYFQGRYGQVELASEGRLYQPTSVVDPGTAADEMQTLNKKRLIILDDGSNRRNPDPVPFIGEMNTLRVGDAVTGLTGILTYAFDAYRIHPIGSVDFQRVNDRDPFVPETGGQLVVASFNVLNYFNGDGKGGGFPTSRGASSMAEFRRQRAKIAAAILSMQADVVGLMEIENDGYGPESAIQDLVTLLNEQSVAYRGSGTYAFVAPEFDLGTDEIKVALIYRQNTVELAGQPATTTESPFGHRRPPLAATFKEKSSGEKFTVVVNHFKSKGCGSASGLNADQSDGQGCWNAERTEAARTLASWLEADPTKSGDQDILIIGDLNCYALEDPMKALEEAGFADLVEQFLGEDAYSYVYAAQSGYLDHALANEELRPQVTGTAIWHINADEPGVVDYNEEDRPGNLYDPGQFRSSDHDPVIVGLNLKSTGPAATQPASEEESSMPVTPPPGRDTKRGATVIAP